MSILRRNSTLKHTPSQLSLSSVSSGCAVEAPEDQTRSTKFRAAVTCVIVCLRFRSLSRRLKAAASLAKADRELDDKPFEAETLFQGRALNAKGVMSKTLSCMRKLLQVDESTQRAIVASLHRIKIAMVRVCWRDHLAPLHDEIERGRGELARAKERFAESRSCYLKELSLLRDATRARSDPTAGIPNFDPMMYFGPEQMCGSPAELECIQRAVSEMLKVIFDKNPHMQSTADVAKLERLRQQTESNEVILLKKQLRQAAQELRDLKNSNKEVNEAHNLEMNRLKQQLNNRGRLSGLVKASRAVNLCCEAAVQQIQAEKAELESRLEAMREQYYELKQSQSELEKETESLKSQLKVSTKKQDFRTSKADACIRELESRTEVAEQENYYLRQELGAVRAELETANAEISNLQELTSMVKQPAKKMCRRLPASHVQVDLCRVASKGDVESLRQVFRTNGSLQHSNVPNYDQRTALHLAAAEGFIEVATSLLDEFGADVNAVDRWGGTPLDDALRGGHVHVAEMLRTRHGKPGQQSEFEVQCDATAREAEIVSKECLEECPLEYQARLVELEGQCRRLEDQQASIEELLQKHLRFTVLRGSNSSFENADCDLEITNSPRPRRYLINCVGHDKGLDGSMEGAGTNLGSATDSVIELMDKVAKANADLEEAQTKLTEELDRQPQSQPMDDEHPVAKLFDLGQRCLEIVEERRCWEAKLLVARTAEKRASCYRCTQLQEEVEEMKAELSKVQHVSEGLEVTLKTIEEEKVETENALSACHASVASAAEHLTSSKVLDGDDPNLKTVAALLEDAEQQSLPLKHESQSPAFVCVDWREAMQSLRKGYLNPQDSGKPSTLPQSISALKSTRSNYSAASSKSSNCKKKLQNDSPRSRDVTEPQMQWLSTQRQQSTRSISCAEGGLSLQRQISSSSFIEGADAGLSDEGDNQGPTSVRPEKKQPDTQLQQQRLLEFSFGSSCIAEGMHATSSFGRSISEGAESVSADANGRQRLKLSSSLASDVESSSSRSSSSKLIGLRKNSASKLPPRQASSEKPPQSPSPGFPSPRRPSKDWKRAHQQAAQTDSSGRRSFVGLRGQAICTDAHGLPQYLPAITPRQTV
eukprot:TRINITY_DN62559_c0_g1_i1.p1 TRINITY_DN62559_c0_g1~~TRINITY_DN62559_c0_g1_i1.p1  ORF type:complete len:1110 (+),score=222.97 TRINITY_DN62559_c0_g1_i1:114-3443(+)